MYPNSPGKSFIQMYKLIREYRVRLLENIFTDNLLIAICWEETFFNNIFQVGGGTGVGFGQTEPGEFPKLESEMAKQKGYYVQGLPRPVSRNGNVASSRPLTDRESIQAQSAMLCHVYFALKGANRHSVLEVYGGVPFSREIARKVREGKMTPEEAKKRDSLGPAKRLERIRGIEKCADMLEEHYEFEYVETSSRETVRAALGLAKGYYRTGAKGEEWERILFPESEKSWWGDYQ